MTRKYVNRAVLALGLIVSGNVFSAGWVEVTPSGSQSSQSYRADAGAAGDQLYMSQSNDTFSEIAERLTGSSDNAGVIARYNGLAPGGVLKQDQLLLIPGLLTGASNRNVGASSTITEFVETEISPAIDTSKPAEIAIAKNVVSRNVDMFIGEVQVLDRVAVQRVAVGNGKIVRAEVLATGELLVIAQAAGSSSIRLWHKDDTQSDYNIRVSENDPETRFHMEKMVRMKVKMVEFRKSALGKLGIDWSDSANGPGLAIAGDAVSNNLFRPAVDGFSGLPNAVKPFSTHFGIASNVTSRINFLATNGDAVMLAEPVLSCANGGNASFLAGGEIPYPTTDSNGNTIVDFKSYGIELKIAPQIDSAGNVRTMIDTEISQLDPAVSIQGAPGLLTRRANTQVNVRSGETIVISGLLTADSSKDIDQLPGLGNLPILGSLFKSKNHRNQVTELVIFVTPEVIDPSSNSLSSRNQQLYNDSASRLERISDSLPIME